MIDEIYFLTKGSAGFVLPLKVNIVYIEIEIGDTFGEIDFVVASKNSGLTIGKIIEKINADNVNLFRNFTI